MVGSATGILNSASGTDQGRMQSLMAVMNLPAMLKSKAFQGPQRDVRKAWMCYYG